MEAKQKARGDSRGVDGSDDRGRALTDSGLNVVRGPALTALPGQSLQGSLGWSKSGCGERGKMVVKRYKLPVRRRLHSEDIRTALGI